MGWADHSQYQVDEEQEVEGARLSLGQEGLCLRRHVPNPRAARPWNG